VVEPDANIDNEIAHAQALAIESANQATNHTTPALNAQYATISPMDFMTILPFR
jgi:hypothetical protein